MQNSAPLYNNHQRGPPSQYPPKTYNNFNSQPKPFVPRQNTNKGFSTWQAPEGVNMAKGTEAQKYKMPNIPISSSEPAPAANNSVKPTLNASAPVFKPFTPTQNISLNSVPTAAPVKKVAPPPPVD